MRLFASTDLGVRILVYMAASPRPRVTIAEMNECYNVKPAAYKGPLKTLITNDIVHSYTGRGGGYSLKRDPTKLTLGEVINLLEGDFNLVPWIEAADETGVIQHPNSVYRFALIHAKAAFFKQLDHYSIAEIAADPYTQEALKIGHLSRLRRNENASGSPSSVRR